MKKVQEPTVTKTQTVTTSRIYWQLLIGLLTGIVVMSVVVLSGQELKHVPPAAPSFMVLHSFDGADGANPQAGLFRDAAGNLYGATRGGGASNLGVVFELIRCNSGYDFKVLHSFTGSDGSQPYGGLIQDAAGNLYGTTTQGGAYLQGVVFKLSPSGTETVLHSFTGGAGGTNPYAGLIRDAAGNLYGTTTGGGATTTCNPPYGCGEVFELIRCNSGYDFKVVYRFSGGADGAGPFAPLILDAAGSLYGTTYSGGGSSQCLNGCGTVFRLCPTGTETILYSFTGGADGNEPRAGLVWDPAGDLYSTTRNGGDSGNGVVFKLSPDNAETVLHSFSGGADGREPLYAGLVRDAAGNLYGTTWFGGSPDQGVVFKLSPSGTETILHTFSGAGGANPYAGLIQDAAGNLYGTASGGGASGWGVVFKLAP